MKSVEKYKSIRRKIYFYKFENEFQKLKKENLKA